MDLEQFKKLTPEAAFKAASEFTGVSVDTLDRLYDAESKRGALAGVKSKAGAEGHFQVLPEIRSTWEKRLGVKLNPLDFHESLYTGMHVLKEHSTSFPDIGDLIKSYHGGYKRDQWGPVTQAYEMYVNGRAPSLKAALEAVRTGSTSEVPTAVEPQGQPAELRTVTNPMDPNDKVELLDQPLSGRSPRPTRAKDFSTGEERADQFVSRNSPSIPTPGFGAASISTPASGDAERLEAKAREEVQNNAKYNTMDKYNASVQDNSLFSVIRMLRRPDSPHEPGHLDYLIKNFSTIEKGYAPHEVERLRSTTSMADLEQTKLEIQMQRDRESALYSGGSVSGAAWQLFGGTLADPMAAVAGVGVAAAMSRTGYAAFQLARRGYGAVPVAAASAAEGALGNLAVDAITSAAGEHVSPGQLVTSAVAGMALGGMFSPLSLKAGRAAAVTDSTNDLRDAIARADADKVIDAAERLGPTATKEQVIAEVRRKEVEDLSAPETPVEAPESTFVRVPEATGDTEVDIPVADVSQKTTQETNVSQKSSADNTSGEATAADEGSVTPIVNVVLPKELRGAKPKYSYGPLQFDLKFESDLDRAAYIAAGPKKSKRDMDYIAFVAENTGLTPEEIRAHGAEVRERIKQEAKGRLDDNDYITVPRMLGKSEANHFDGTHQIPLLELAANEQQLRGLDFRGAVQWTMENARTLVEREVAAAVRSAFEKLEAQGHRFEFRVSDKLEAHQRGVNTRKQDADGKWTNISEVASVKSKLPGTSHEVVQHELIHAVTAAYVQTNPNSQAVKDLSRLLDDLRAELNDPNSRWAAVYKANKLPALKDVDELLAYGLTNTAFQRWLHAMPSSNGGNWFSRMLSIVAKALGLKGDTRLDELFSVGERILKETNFSPSPRSAAQAILEMRRAKNSVHVDQLEEFLSKSAVKVPLYHGTSKDADFSAFNKNRRGTWLTTDPAEASAYAKDNDSKKYVWDGGRPVAVNTADRVMKLYAQIENPYTLTQVDKDLLSGKTKPGESYAKTQAEFADRLRMQGYDGFHAGGNVWVVLDPKKVKSATGNRGSYNTSKAGVNEAGNLVGTDLIDDSDAVGKADRAQIEAVHIRAHAWDSANPPKANTLVGALVDWGLGKLNLRSTGSRLADSKHPVARMWAGLALENTTGKAGRRTTAALVRDTKLKQYLSLISKVYDKDIGLHGLYKMWGDANGRGGLLGDIASTETYHRWNMRVAEEVEARKSGRPRTQDQAVSLAADLLERGYTKMLKDQVSARTIGFSRLPKNSEGYMPHRWDGTRVREMTNDQRRVIVAVYAEQFENALGFDRKFSDSLAKKMLEHLLQKSLGGVEIPANLARPEMSMYFQQALQSLGLKANEIEKAMGRMSQGGASHTKARLDLDVLKEYPLADGSKFRLIDLMDVDHFRLYEGYARRVAGEVALAHIGVLGKPGLEVIERAMKFSRDGQAITNEELEAFRQTAAEFLNAPYGNFNNPHIDNGLALVRATKLGGAAFPQMGELANAIGPLGVQRTLALSKDIPRMIRQVVTGARDPVLDSLEAFIGPIGRDYKMIIPHTDPDKVRVYGRAEIGMIGRITQALGHATPFLSLHHYLVAGQTRGVYVQIIDKAVRMARDNAPETGKYFMDMGITPDIVQALRDSLPYTAKFDGDTLVSFDLTKMKDLDAARSFANAAKRGAGQIIQNTFLGETNPWVHNGVLRLLSQFRTFSIAASEKQLARQYGVAGAARFAGLAMASVSWGAMLHLARLQMQSAGMSSEQRKEFLKDKITPMAIWRSSMNYSASLGLLPDMLDVTAGMFGEDLVGVRGASGPDVLSSVPALGMLSQTVKTASKLSAAALDRVRGEGNGVLENEKLREFPSPQALLRSMPMGNNILAVPLLNAITNITGMEGK